MRRQPPGWVRPVVLVLALVCQGLLVPAYQVFPSPVHLDISPLSQQMDKWCWAASAQMIMRFLKGKQPEQCEMASFVTKQKHCCKDDNTSAYPYPARCDDTGWPPFAHYRYDSQQTKNTALTFVELQTQLSNNKPVAFSQRFIVSGDPVERGHMLVAIGYSVDSSGQWVEVNNPTYASRSFILYDTYVAIPGQTAHWNDYYDIAKRP